MERYIRKTGLKTDDKKANCQKEEAYVNSFKFVYNGYGIVDYCV